MGGKRLISKMPVVVPVILTVMLVFAGVLAASPSPAAGKGRPKVVMVILDRVTVDDITDKQYKNINEMMARGGLGLMTTNSGGDLSDLNAFASLGGGDKFIGSALAGESYNRDEVLADGAKAYEVYRRNTGKDPGPYKVLNTSIAATLKVNSKRFTASTPGQLGNVLHKAGLKTAVIGNSDFTPEMEPNRIAATIAMDDLGRVDDGNVGTDLLEKDPAAPFGWRTDYGKLGSELERVWSTGDFIVVETGDTIRANENSNQQMKRMVEIHRANMIRYADEFIGSLLPRIGRDTLVMLVTPLPHAEALRNGIRLTPVIMAGGNIAPGSVLTSPSTRQKGLVANYDVTATVAAHLGAKPAESIIGLPVQGVKQAGQAGYITDMYEWLTANSRQRIGVIFYFIRYQWVVYTVAFLLLAFRKFRNTRIMRGLMAGILVYPLAILVTPITGSVNPSLTIFLSLAIMAVLAYIVTGIRDDLKMFIAIAAANALPAVADVLAGGALMKKAALSYDIVVGGRFYGIGNEYMGVVIGSVILGTAALLQSMPEARRKLKILVGLLFTGLILFFAAPTVGSKAGGAITAMVGFAVAMYGFMNRKIRPRSGILLLAALIAGVAVLALVNFLFPVGEQSHIGRAFNNLFSGNFFVIWQMTMRKLTANLYLLQHSPFSIVLLLQFLIWGILLIRNREALGSIFEKMPFLKSGMSGMFFGALAAIALNDSGVIGSPLLLNYLIVPLVLLAAGAASADRQIKPGWYGQ